MKLEAKVTSIKAIHDIIWGDTMRIPDEYRNVMIIKFELLEEFKKAGFSLQELQIFEDDFHVMSYYKDDIAPYTNIPDLEIGCIIEISEPLHRADTFGIPGYKLTDKEESVFDFPGSGFTNVSGELDTKSKPINLPPLSLKTVKVASATEKDSVVKVIKKAKNN